MSQLLNICLQVIEALIIFNFFELVSNTYKGKLKHFAYIVLGYMIMTVLNLIFNYNVFINCSAMIVFMFLFSYFLYGNKLGISLFYSPSIVCLVGVSEISVINIVSAITGDDSRGFIQDTASYVLVIVFSKAILFIGLRFISAIVGKSKSIELSSIGSIVYPITLVLTIVDFIVVSYNYELKNESKVLLSISSIFLIVSVIATCIIEQQSSQKEQELKELRTIQQRQEIENSYFELLEHQNDELQIFVHDMKKHLNNISQLYETSNEAQTYIKNLSDELSSANKIGKSSNKLLDLIIDKYDYICRKNNIRFETNIFSTDLNIFSDNDITSIFNNMLDNAVTASANSEKKEISLLINTYNKILSIKVLNSCDIAPNSNGDRLITSKKDKAIHGFGFKSICKSIRKYNGDIDWEYDEDKKQFGVTILISLP